MENKFPKISIITPSYNQAQFIEETINSVLGQNYPNLEYIVIDGGSTDGTIDILKKYGSQIQWISEKDRGQSHAINKGLQMATGDVVAYLNSDDCYESGALLRVGQFFASHPKAAWVTGQCTIIDPNGLETRRPIKWYKNILLRLHSHPLLQVIDYVSQPATFWRRSVIDKIGSFDECHHLVMDYDYSLRVGQHYKLWVIHTPLAKFRVHDSSKSISQSSAQFSADLETAAHYTKSKLLLNLHAIHNALVIGVYWYMSNKHRISAAKVKVITKPESGSQLL